MKVYLSSIATNLQEIDTRVYETFEKSLNYIYDSLKKLVSEEIDDCVCDFFDRDYVQKYFNVDFFGQTGQQFHRIVCKSTYGEFIIDKVREDKYQFIFSPISSNNINFFIVCELQILELLN